MPKTRLFFLGGITRCRYLFEIIFLLHSGEYYQALLMSKIPISITKWDLGKNIYEEEIFRVFLVSIINNNSSLSL